MLLKTHKKENEADPSTSTRQEAMHDNDLKPADAVQANVVASMSSDSANHARKNVLALNACNLENITSGKDSRQTIILEGGGSMRARNIATGDGSVQLIGQLSGAALQKIIQS
ncbi:unnamed protein product [Fusarium graminearum]|uniref:Uncharacterized protein n=1 Tax=Gibberella zeae TaxID=5518 RepID=A0A9N8X059_GIBZA|nr:unnamed protein product [Fusarium graminearum]